MQYRIIMDLVISVYFGVFVLIQISLKFIMQDPMMHKKLESS